MQQLLNTLFVMTEGSSLHLDHETVKVEMRKKPNGPGAGNPLIGICAGVPGNRHTWRSKE